MRNLTRERILRMLAVLLAVVWVAGMGVLASRADNSMAAVCFICAYGAGPIVAGLLARQLLAPVAGWVFLALVVPVLALPILALQPYGGQVRSLIRTMKAFGRSNSANAALAAINASNSLNAIRDLRLAAVMINEFARADADIQEELAFALRNMKGPGLARLLIVALQSKSVAVRCNAAKLLGECGEPEARGPLEQRLNDPSADVQAAARRALTAMSTSQGL
jgi:hypothetical protein